MEGVQATMRELAEKTAGGGAGKAEEKTETESPESDWGGKNSGEMRGLEAQRRETDQGERPKNMSSVQGEFTREGEPLDTTRFHNTELDCKLVALERVHGARRCSSRECYVARQRRRIGRQRYLAETAKAGITVNGIGEVLEAFCDADYAGDVNTRRSKTGYVFVYGGWSSRSQTMVAVSTIEAEYMSAGNAVKDHCGFASSETILGWITERARFTAIPKGQYSSSSIQSLCSGRNTLT